jgi:hypothetical protein
MNNVGRIEPAPVPPAARLKALIVALLCVLFLLNLTGGLIEIPDCLPIIGNLDEVVATVVLLRCLGRMGVTGLPGPR